MPTPEIVSKYLDSIGIRGSVFNDASSRRPGIEEDQRVRNHVIFNDKNLHRVSTRVAGDDADIKFSKAAPDLDAAKTPEQRQGGR